MKTSFCRRLGLDLPIVQAPMAGGWTTPALVAAVCNAGGLGMLAAARLSVAQLQEQIEAVRRMTSRPFGVNFLLAPPDAPPSDVSPMQHVLATGRSRLGLAPGPLSLPPQASPLAGQLDLVCRVQVPVVSFALGDPAPWAGPVKAGGTFVMAMATTVADAVRLQACGVDAVVAQGCEAGGHRSSIDAPSDAEPPLIGLMALVPQMVDALRVPVVAAGGIMDGRGVLAALALGAEAVQLGTRFLLAAESGAFPAYRQRLVEGTETDTVVTRCLTGRPARALRNELLRTVEAAGVPVLGWPYQALAAEDLYRAAAAQGDAAWAPLYAGQGLRLAGGVSPAADIMSSLMQQAALQLDRLNQAR